MRTKENKKLRWREKRREEKKRQGEKKEEMKKRRVKNKNKKREMKKKRKNIYIKKVTENKSNVRTCCRIGIASRKNFDPPRPTKI